MLVFGTCAENRLEVRLSFVQTQVGDRDPCGRHHEGSHRRKATNGEAARPSF